MFEKLFRTPYLDAETDVGGGSTTETASQETQPTEQQTQEVQTEQPKFKVKFNHEEKELSYDEAVQYAQKGLNYDRIYPEYEKLRNNPHMSYLDQKAKKLGITIDQLIENDRKYEEQEALNQLVQQNIPEEYAKEMLESRKFREQMQAKEQQIQAKEKQDAMYKEFLEAYPDIKGEEIPPEVWQEVDKGRNLLDAYVRHENKLLKDKLNAAAAQQQTQQANQENAAASTGSAKGEGKTNGYFTQDQVRAMSQSEVTRNLKAIEESMKHWK